ncbi:hypothetical protein BDV98DRAFT_608652 [Pterulicium gracile]|uniref:Uncharacterized protein n=1 Tax=Pterulicium gracile TaxID=1884261 RepID=A0A5C3Q195_9AGAR|nr:hypothetical protein BDV98DRAFT_608652 [Pterula gracilis]
MGNNGLFRCYYLRVYYALRYKVSGYSPQLIPQLHRNLHNQPNSLLTTQPPNHPLTLHHQWTFSPPSISSSISPLSRRLSLTRLPLLSTTRSSLLNMKATSSKSSTMPSAVAPAVPMPFALLLDLHCAFHPENLSLNHPLTGHNPPHPTHIFYGRHFSILIPLRFGQINVSRMQNKLAMLFGSNALLR